MRRGGAAQVDAAAVLRAVDMGPAAEDPAAAEFRAFWGERAELRRFQARARAARAPPASQPRPARRRERHVGPPRPRTARSRRP